MTANDIGAADCTLEPLRDCLQQLVANGMSQCIVDDLEPVQIKKQDSQFFVVPLYESDGLGDAVA